MTPIWPIVGRDEELGLLEEAIAAGELGAVVIAGDPGVGKSRLIDEALARAAAGGVPTERVRATGAAASIPFAAFAALPGVTVDVSGGRVGLMRELAAALRERAGGRRFVLGVDDAHLLDDGSAALVHHLAETDAAVVIAGIRSGEVAPDAVTKLWKDGPGERLDLQPLSKVQGAELLERALGGPVDGGAQRRIWATSEGNALYLRELVLGALEDGSLAEVDGVWRLTGGINLAPRLADLLEERLAAVGASDRAALELLALAEPIEPRLLGSTLADGAIETAERNGLVETREEGERLIARLSHPLYGELLRSQVPARAARRIKGELADALEAQPRRRREDLLRLAAWRLESGSEAGPRVFLEASAQAAAGFDFELAERLARAALAAGGGAEARQGLAAALVGGGAFARADAELAAAEAEAASEAQRVEVAIARADNLYWRLGEGDAAVALLAGAERSASGRAGQGALAAARAGLLLFEGGTGESIELALGLLDGSGPADPIAWQAAMTAGWGCVCAGRVETALTVIERFGKRAAAHPEQAPPFAPFWFETARVVALALAGRFAESLGGGRAAYEAAVEREAETGRTMIAFGLGWATQLQGDAAAAARWLREAVGHLREVDSFRQLSAALGELAQVEALLGDVAAAEAALADAEAVRVECFRMDERAVGLGRAWVAAARGETSSGAREALRTAQVTRSLGQYGLEAIALHDALRLGSREAVARLGRLDREADAPLLVAFSAHARALAARTGAGLEAVSAEFEELGASLYAAEAAAEASRAFEREGREASARAAATRAGSLRAAIGAVRTPAFARLEVPELSEREREIATLATGGLSNREIAERLVVSVRTVENHLHAVYGKLGIGGRADLATLLEVE